MHTCLKQKKFQIEIHDPRIFMGKNSTFFYLDLGHSPPVWPSAKSFLKGTQTGLLISTADGVGNGCSMLWFLKLTYLAVRLVY